MTVKACKLKAPMPNDENVKNDRVELIDHRIFIRLRIISEPYDARRSTDSM